MLNLLSDIISCGVPKTSKIKPIIKNVCETVYNKSVDFMTASIFVTWCNFVLADFTLYKSITKNIPTAK